MARKWLNDGKPLEDGRLCLVIDPEDGTNPIRVYGRTKDEILDKTARTVEGGQRALTQARSTATTQTHNRTVPPGESHTNGTAAVTAQAPPPKTTLTDGERLQLTADLSNPSKAPAAVTRLVQHHTGINLEEQARQQIIDRVMHIAITWEDAHPEFPGHPANRKMMMDTAAQKVGFENITASVLDGVFNQLQAEGYLVEAAADESQPPTVQPPETADTRTVRPRGAASHRRTITSPAPVAASNAPKYTKEQIEAMPSAEYRRKLETDSDFAAAVNALYGEPANA